MPEPVAEPFRSPAGRRGGRFAELSSPKPRGGYYTAREVAAWLCAWAIRAPTDAVLEPACGDGVFLAAAAERLAALGAPAPAVAGQLTGIEVVPGEAAAARARLAGRPVPGAGKASGARAAGGADAAGAAGAAVVTADFFAWWRRPGRRRFDAVVGNPPFIRYQSFPEPHRGRAMAILAGLGLTPNRLTNSWVPFVAAAAATLVEGGRLALVLPAELLQVGYAAQLRSFLACRFARLDLIACNEMFFAGAEQEVLLLLADGAIAPRADTTIAPGADTAAAPGADSTAAPGAEIAACRVALTETHTAEDLVSRPAAAVLAGAVPKTVHHGEEKWLKYFLTGREIDLMRELRGASAVTSLRTHGGVDVGVVTGSNEFFVLSRRQVGDLGLAGHTVPLVSRSAQLVGASITAADWQVLSAADARVHLLCPASPGRAPLAPPLARYVEDGEARGCHRGYKCSLRTPWYAVPAAWVPDAFVLRQIHEFPRFVRNAAAATSTDTIHRLTCTADPDAVIAGAYTHLTAASAEIEGRSYGGGVLELEPTEAERLLVPARLGAALPLAECDRLVRGGRLDQALAENDRLVLAGQLGLARADCAMLRAIWVKLRDRRTARRRRRPPRPAGAASATRAAALRISSCTSGATAPPTPQTA